MFCGSWLWNDSIVAESPVSANQLDRSAVNFSSAGVVHAELRLVARADAVVAEGLRERLLGRFQQFAKLRRKKCAGNVHLFLPVLRANHSRRDGRAAFATRAVREQRGKFVGFAVVPIPNPI